MKREDFKEITEKHIEIARKIIRNNGYCNEIICGECPFHIFNNSELEGCRGKYSDLGTNKKLLQSAKEFLEMCKSTGAIIGEGTTPEDKVNSPNHYKLKINGNDIEVIDIIRAVLTPEEFRGYEKGNVLKYILREKNKNGLEDLKKGNKYLDWLIREEEK